MDNIFLYLLGFAGTGKLTIARAFARSVGAKVVDNHWINNPIFGLIDPDGVSPLPDAVWSQTAKVREAVLETIATLAKPGANFVFTHDGIEGERYDADVWRGIQSAAARRGARLIPVRLVCSEDELVRRIQSADRAAMLKCTDPADAIHKSRHHAVLDPRLPGTLTLDVTSLTPEQSVEAIVAHIKSLGS
jgi:predicted kinase